MCLRMTCRLFGIDCNPKVVVVPYCICVYRSAVSLIVVCASLLCIVSFIIMAAIDDCQLSRLDYFTYTGQTTTQYVVAITEHILKHIEK